MTGLQALRVALNLRNRQAAKVRGLEDRLYEARQALTELERQVSKAHADAPDGTLIAYGAEGWEITR